jgi:hypothetical protein
MFREIHPELNRQRNPSNAEHELRTTKAKATMLTEKIEDKERKANMLTGLACQNVCAAEQLMYPGDGPTTHARS